jgi:hypothetical protein
MPPLTHKDIKNMENIRKLFSCAAGALSILALAGNVAAIAAADAIPRLVQLLGLKVWCTGQPFLSWRSMMTPDDAWLKCCATVKCSRDGGSPR